jgi:hypothetical protein
MHLVPGRPQRADRPDHGERLPAFRRSDGEALDQRQDHRRDGGNAIELTTAIDKKRRIDTAYEVYLGLYQAITGPEERQKLFREFSTGFFDLIVIDECHRGSAAGFGLARNPRILFRRHADRPHRHAEGGEDGETLPDKPGADETIVDGLPDITLPLIGGKMKKIYVDGVGATVIAERAEYLDENGKLVTESLRDFTKKALRKRFASLDDFLKRWKAAERKQAIVEELEAEGLPLDPIAEELGKDLDPFDLICHVAFDKKPLTRRERAENVKKRNVFTKYGDQARAVLDALLTKYADEGVLNLDDANVLRIPPINSLGTLVQLIKAFGGTDGFEQAVHELQSALIRKPRNPCPSAPSSNPFRTSCVRTPVSMATRSGSANCAGCSS